MKLKDRRVLVIMAGLQSFTWCQALVPVLLEDAFKCRERVEEYRLSHSFILLILIMVRF